MKNPVEVRFFLVPKNNPPDFLRRFIFLSAAKSILRILKSHFLYFQNFWRFFIANIFLCRPEFSKNNVGESLLKFVILNIFTSPGVFFISLNSLSSIIVFFYFSLSFPYHRKMLIFYPNFRCRVSGGHKNNQIKKRG